MTRPLRLVCTYHKTGTMLFLRLMREVCQAAGWRVASRLGRVDHIPERLDVALLPHSTLDWSCLDRPTRIVHVVRDPRDVWVSGYLYHLRCTERWCRSVPPMHPADADLVHPLVPHAIAHRPVAFKRAYLDALGGRSYQAVLHDLDAEDGLAFELRHYAGWTIEAMLDWPWGQRDDVLEVRFEAMMSHFDETLERVLAHLEVPITPELWARCTAHDLGRKSAAELETDPHVFSRATSRWRDCFTPRVASDFAARFPDAVQRLGYDAT